MKAKSNIKRYAESIEAATLMTDIVMKISDKEEQDEVIKEFEQYISSIDSEDALSMAFEELVRDKASDKVLYIVARRIKVLRGEMKNFGYYKTVDGERKWFEG